MWRKKSRSNKGKKKGSYKIEKNIIPLRLK